MLATDHPRPAGTYTENIDLIRAQDCTICPLRHACLQGTGGETQTMLDCGPGFFCPNGTAYSNQFPCLPGTWSSSTSLAAAEECNICPPGRYCQGGKSFIDGNCAPGHYCPLGTYSSTQFPCPSGTYTSSTSLFEPSQCDDCPPGYYCPAGLRRSDTLQGWELHAREQHQDSGAGGCLASVRHVPGRLLLRRSLGESQTLRQRQVLHQRSQGVLDMRGRLLLQQRHDQRSEYALERGGVVCARGPLRHVLQRHVLSARIG